MILIRFSVSRFNPIIFDCPLPQSYLYNGTDSYGVQGVQSHIKAVYSSVPRRTFLMAIMVVLYSVLTLVSIIDSLVRIYSEEAKTINEFLSNLPMVDVQLHSDYLVLVEVCSHEMFSILFLKGQFEEIPDFQRCVVSLPSCQNRGSRIGR